MTSVVSAMQLSSALYARLEVTAPWGIRFAKGAGRARFGFVAQGSCWLRSDCLPHPQKINPGECFLFLDSAEHILSDIPSGDAESCVVLMEKYGVLGSHHLRFGGGGAATTLITGWFGFDPSTSRYLLNLLPRLLVFSCKGDHAEALHATLKLLTTETADNALGKTLVIRGLADVLFVHAIRIHMASPNKPHEGILAALADPQLGRAIHAIHAALDRRWTVASLAHFCGMSRSAFALKFKNTVGQTPMEYLTVWRMQVAGRLLRRDMTKSISQIANEVGYETESAFSKIFRKSTGTPPGSYRRGSHRQENGFS